jgi:RNA polymerase sigma-70 factor (ECF subfamily)
MDDVAPVIGAQNGSRLAFSTLVTQYRDIVFRICLQFTRNVPDAEDLAHDAFIEAFLKLPQLRQPDRFDRWLRTLTLNMCRAWHRRTRREVEHAVAVPVVGVTDEPDAAFWKGLAMLSHAQRVVLRLHYWDGLSYAETALFLGVPIGTVMSRLHRARSALKDALLRNDEDGDDTMTLSQTFADEVDAEINVIMESFSRERGAAQRLSVLLERTPERFARLLRESSDVALLKHLALLTLRLGAPASRALLDAALSDDPALVDRSCVVASHWRKSSYDLPSPEMYRLLDALVATPNNDASKVAILRRWLDAAYDDETVNLVADVLCCYTDAAFTSLWRDFVAETLSSRGLHALCRTGRRFGIAATALLESEDIHARHIALKGLEALGRCAAGSPKGRVPAEASLLVRRWANWAPVPDSLLDADDRAGIAATVLPLVASSDETIRNMAIRVVGLFGTTAETPRIVPLLKHDARSTRVATIRALGDLLDATTLRTLLELEPASEYERKASKEALTRLVYHAAVPALAERLRGFVGSQDDALAMLHRSDAAPVLDTLELARDHYKMRSAATALSIVILDAVDPVRNEKTPSYAERAGVRDPEDKPPFHVSLDAAIRALPEMREYDEMDLTRRIASVCGDYSSTRRFLVENGSRALMRRECGVFAFTELGKAAWRVEHFIVKRYLKP